MTTTRPRAATGPRFTVLVIGVILVAANLRANIVPVGSLLPRIERETGISSGLAGLLSTLPLLTFAAISPLVAPLARRFEQRRLLWWALVVLVTGVTVRSLPSVTLLFAGTLLLSIAVAVGNVLLPAIIRSGVPDQAVGRVSGYYVVAMGAVAALASGVAVPLAVVLPGGWRSSLAATIPIALAALAAWSIVVLDRTPGPSVLSRAARSTPWRSGLAWQVTLFMGTQSLIFFTMVAWLPTIAQSGGMNETSAGSLLLVLQLVGLVASMSVPWLTRFVPDDGVLASIASVFVCSAIALLLLSPDFAPIAAVVFGAGGGVIIVLALAFQSQRAADAQSAAALAGMAQSVGYLLAAIGPVTVGLLHDWTGNWRIELVMLLLLAVLMIPFGRGAGRKRTLDK